jgi:F420-non-reducing hydrogenase small subunit
MSEKKKLQVAIYWGAACGGCCVSVLDVHEKILDIAEVADIVFWPIALDTKYADVEAMPDKSIDLCLYNGAIRNSENAHMAQTLRKKSKVMVALGACAHLGGIPGLANLSDKEAVFRRVYRECESNDNPHGVVPTEEIDIPEGKLELPKVFNDVRSLSQTVQVDYFIPGCPPESSRIMEVLTAIVSGAQLPPLGSVVGADDKINCDTCKRTRSENKKVKRFYRPWEVQDDGTTCLLEQGIICMGPATRAGCETRCLKSNQPCGGCYGPTPNMPDPGAGMISAIATMIDSDDPTEIQQIVDQVVDPVGTFYRFSVPASILRRALK